MICNTCNGDKRVLDTSTKLCLCEDGYIDGEYGDPNCYPDKSKTEIKEELSIYYSFDDGARDLSSIDNPKF